MAKNDTDLRWYPTKVDWWMVPLLAIPFLACGAVLIAAIVTGKGMLVGLLSTGLMAAVFGGLVLPMRYAISDTELLVRHGLITQRAKLTEIREVYPTRNPLSSPALSLDRLWISTGEGYFKSIMISPLAKAEFLAELEQRAGLRRVGEKLVR